MCDLSDICFVVPYVVPYDYEPNEREVEEGERERGAKRRI